MKIRNTCKLCLLNRMHGFGSTKVWKERKGFSHASDSSLFEWMIIIYRSTWPIPLFYCSSLLIISPITKFKIERKTIIPVDILEHIYIYIFWSENMRIINIILMKWSCMQLCLWWPMLCNLCWFYLYSSILGEM